MPNNNNESTTKFKVDISELVNGMQQAKRQIALANAEFKASTAGMDNWSKSADGVSAKLTQLDKTLAGQKSVLSKLEEQYRLTAEQMGADSKEAENLRIKIENQKASIGKTEKEIRNYTKALADIESEANSGADAIEELADSTEDASESAKNAEGGFTVLKGALASLVADGIRMAIDAFKELAGAQSQASNIFQASTGVATEAMSDYNDAIESIYKNNFGESLQDVAEKMAKVKEVTGELDAGKLQEMTEAGLTLEDTFGMDMTETLRGVQSLMDHFGMSSEEAFDLIASGAQNGLNFTDELGDNVAEYAGKFAEAGYSSEEYFQLLKNGADGGAYNLDKVNDAINEVTTRLADGTIDDSINMFSSGTQDVFEAWKTGGATQKEVIDSIVKDIQNTKGEQDKMNLSALAFGTMAEDGGTKFIESLSAVGDSFTDTKGKMDEIKEIRYDDVMSELSGLGRTIKLDLITPIVQELLPPIKTGLQWMIDNSEVVKAGIVGIGTAFLAWKAVSIIDAVTKSIKAFQLANEGATIAQWALNTAMSANPIGIVIALIAGLVTAFIMLWNKSDAFREFWINLWENLKNIVSKGAKAIGGFFSNLWKSITEKFSKLASWFSETVIEPVSKFFSGMWSSVKKGASDAWSGIKSVFSSVAKFFGDIFGSAWSKVKDIFSTGGKIFDGIKDGIFNVFKAIVNTLIRGINTVVSIPFNAINGMLNTIRNVGISGIKPFKALWGKNPINVPQIPQLYQGGVLKKGQVGYLEGNGDEAVVPLDHNTGWLDEVARRIVDKGGLSAGKAQNVTNNYSYEYKQTNNSPKALNRLEIYRQSKNLFNYNTGGVI